MSEPAINRSKIIEFPQRQDSSSAGQRPEFSETLNQARIQAQEIGQMGKLAERLVGQDDPRVRKIENNKQRADALLAGEAVRQKRMEQPYILSPELHRIVQVARILKKPLLLEGEPGTGKTALPHAIAAELGMNIIFIQCKTTTIAQELLYTYDHTKKMRDAQMGLDTSDDWRYIKLGPLGRAFLSNEPTVLLIDEVDKARPDFLNDLLHELDQKSFFIAETGEEIATSSELLLFFTSNHEKDLPNAALRRCVYYYLDFPTPEHMREIVNAHVPDVSEKLLNQAIEQFYELRLLTGIQKKPSSSEMLDWIKILSAFGVHELEGVAPHLETLIKNQDDLKIVLKHQREMLEILKELGIKRSDLVLCFEPPVITHDREYEISRRIAGKDELGNVIIKLSDGVCYIKTVLTEAERDSSNYYSNTLGRLAETSDFERLRQPNKDNVTDAGIEEEEIYEVDEV